MTIEDAEHLSPDQREAIIASYPPHERDARTKGIPALGSGRVFPVADDEITTPPFAIPDHYARIGALDFGYDHPTAAVSLAHDRDADIVYLSHCYRVKERTPVHHAAALKPWGKKLPWAWPHDGFRRSGRGEPGQASLPLKDEYKGHGLNMLPHRAQFKDGSNCVEAGIMLMLERMETGRFKVFDNCLDWFKEFRQYHRKDGIIVKDRDDLMDATRYAIMCLRFARPIREKEYDDPYDDDDGHQEHNWMTA